MNHSKYLASIMTLLLLVACSNPGQVIDGNGTVFSEYFRCMIYVQGGDLSFDAMKTLGKERMPEGYEFSAGDKTFLNSPDTIEEVYEVYVRNHSGSPIEITLLETTEGSQKRTIAAPTYSIEPGKWKKTEPIISVSSIYGPEKVACSVTYNYLGNTQTAQGTMRRLTVEELRR